MLTIPVSVAEALKIAQIVRQNAHAPYSRLHVGAAIKLVPVDEIVGGCNVENASYGATICAERVGMGRAVSQFGFQPIEFLVLTSDSPAGTVPPCGMCLQVLQEFAEQDFPIYLADSKHIVEKVMFSQLLPRNFKPSMLP